MSKKDQLLANETDGKAESPAKPFRLLSGIINERALLHAFKAQRQRQEAPSGAFANALTDVEWLPGDRNPDKPQLAPFLTVNEISQLTQSIVLDIPFGQLPQHKKGPKHRLTKEEVTERHSAIMAFLKSNGAKTMGEIEFEQAGLRPTSAACEIMLSKRHDKTARYIGRRHLPYHHPLYGHKVPLAVHAAIPDHTPEPNYPHTGCLLLNSGELDRKTGDVWSTWSGFHRKDIERMPNNTDSALTVQLHEVGHIAQKGALRLYNIHSLETNYRIEHNADMYALEGYRRLGAPRGAVELMLALSFLSNMQMPKNNAFSFYHAYWYGMALLHGRTGPDKWPLYRSAAAALELHYLGSAYLFRQVKPYNSRLFNSTMKEALLNLHERPPKKTENTIDYGHVEAAFNSVARNQHLTPDEMQTVEAFNTFARARTELRTRKYANCRHLGLLAAYRELWNSSFPLNDDTLLVLGLTLEAAALLRPSLRTETKMPAIFADPEQALIQPRRHRTAKLA